MKLNLWLIGSLFLIWSCKTPKPKGGLPPMLEGKVAPALVPIQEVVALAKKKTTQKTYQAFVAGQPDGSKSEPQWTRVYLMQGGMLKYREVYNIYKDKAGKVEYSVWEMDVNPTDTTRRHSARDYQVIVTADSAYYGPLDQQYVHVRQRLDIPVIDDTLKVYRMEGFAHASDIQPGNIKFWSPDLGTLLMYTGESRTFELVKAPGFPKEKLDVLMAAVRKEVE